MPLVKVTLPDPVVAMLDKMATVRMVERRTVLTDLIIAADTQAKAAATPPRAPGRPKDRDKFEWWLVDLHWPDNRKQHPKIPAAHWDGQWWSRSGWKDILHRDNWATASVVYPEGYPDELRIYNQHKVGKIFRETGLVVLDETTEWEDGY